MGSLCVCLFEEGGPQLTLVLAAHEDELPLDGGEAVVDADLLPLAAPPQPEAEDARVAVLRLERLVGRHHAVQQPLGQTEAPQARSQPPVTCKFVKDSSSHGNLATNLPQLHFQRNATGKAMAKLDMKFGHGILPHLCAMPPPSPPLRARARTTWHASVDLANNAMLPPTDVAS